MWFIWEMHRLDEVVKRCSKGQDSFYSAARQLILVQLLNTILAASLHYILGVVSQNSAYTVLEEYTVATHRHARRSKHSVCQAELRYQRTYRTILL